MYGHVRHPLARCSPRSHARGACLGCMPGVHCTICCTHVLHELLLHLCYAGSLEGSLADTPAAALPTSAAGAAVSDSPGLPFSPSSAEPSSGVPADGTAGVRSVHGRPPGKQPYPHDRTPEAEAARASLQPQPGGGAGDGAAAGGSDGGAAAPPAGPRSVHRQPPGKQPHPDDPHFGGSAGSGREGEAAEAAAAQGSGGDAAAAVDAGPRSVLGRPPGKQPQQVALIAQAYQGYSSEEEEPVSPLAAAAAVQHAPWQQQHAAAQAYVHAPAGSSHGAAPGLAAGASRKRPASQPLGGEAGQRKRPANGGAAAAGAADSPTLQRLPTGVSSSHRGYSTGVPASLARTGSFHGVDARSTQQIRLLAGAPRSLQQRQQLAAANGGAGAAPRQPAGASRSKQAAGGAAAKPKQAAKAASSGQRKSTGGGGAARAVPAAAYKPGDVVWAKIGVYPWWPAQLQRPTSDEHFKPKHAASDLFCVFYGGVGWGVGWGGARGGEQQRGREGGWRLMGPST